MQSESRGQKHESHRDLEERSQGPCSGTPAPYLQGSVGMLDLVWFGFCLWLVAAMLSLAHVLIIPEGTLKRKDKR